MTVIVALRHDKSRKVVMGGDRRVSGLAKENIILTMTKPKVWSSNGFLFGFAGTMEGELLQTKFTPPKLTGNVDNFMNDAFLNALYAFYEKWDIYKDRENDGGLGMLIAVDKFIYEHDPAFMTMTCYEGDYFALGSGSQYALGSLFSTEKMSNPKVRVQMAVESAAKFTPTCGLPVDIISHTFKADTP